MLDQPAFELLSNVLMEGWGLPLKYFPDPYADLTELDLGIRLHMKESDRLYAQIRSVVSQLEFGKILLIRDSYHLDSVLVRASPDHQGFYNIGPFRSQAATETASLADIYPGLTTAQIDATNYLFRRVPVNIPQAVGLSVAKNILLVAYGIQDPEVERHSFERVGAPDSTPLEDINDRARRVEIIYQHEAKLLSYIAEGNEARALEEAQFFFHSGIDQRLKTGFFLAERWPTPSTPSSAKQPNGWGSIPSFWTRSASVLPGSWSFVPAISKSARLTSR